MKNKVFLMISLIASISALTSCNNLSNGTAETDDINNFLEYYNILTDYKSITIDTTTGETIFTYRNQGDTFTSTFNNSADLSYIKQIDLYIKNNNAKLIYTSITQEHILIMQYSKISMVKI